ncbi:hypothetical protein H4582DRAFT_456870 [Lactarius indigo]|nr:hypothetical protein H4582DRAFT_456870 [Lactarius indigo]
MSIDPLKSLSRCLVSSLLLPNLGINCSGWSCCFRRRHRTSLDWPASLSFRCINSMDRRPKKMYSSQPVSKCMHFQKSIHTWDRSFSSAFYFCRYYCWQLDQFRIYHSPYSHELRTELLQQRHHYPCSRAPECTGEDIFQLRTRYGKPEKKLTCCNVRV